MLHLRPPHIMKVQQFRKRMAAGTVALQAQASLEHLGRLTGLSSLDLQVCVQVGDSGLRRLSGLTELERLCLLGKRVTTAGIARLCSCLPRLNNLLEDARCARMIGARGC